MSIFDALTISASALSAERQRSEVIAANMANSETTHTAAGGPFHRREVIFRSTGSSFQFALANAQSMTGPPAGLVQISQVVDAPPPPVMKYAPGPPAADKDGYVAYPAINPATEMVDLMGSVRAFQLNATAVNATKQMIQQSIDILKS